MRNFLIKLAALITVGLIVTIGWLFFSYYMQPGLGLDQILVGAIGWALIIEPAWTTWSKRINNIFKLNEDGKSNN